MMKEVSVVLIAFGATFPSPMASEGAIHGSPPAASVSSPAGEAIMVEYYYKLVPGAMVPGGPSEWWALYKKNHHPILKQLMKEGLILSERAFERRFHAESPAWDYKVVMVWRDWGALQQANERQGEIATSLYPDKAAHEREERRRWELTERHWDDVLKEVALD